MHDESANLPETLNNATAKVSLHTGQCVRYQKVVLTQIVIWFTFMPETKAQRSLHIVQSTGLEAYGFCIFQGALNWKMY